MKGLILKDLYVLKDTLKIYLLFFILYGYMGIAEGETAIMYTMLLLTSALLPVTSISYDERCRWDRLANTMPLSRKDIVLGKYLLSTILLVASAVVISVMMIFEKNMSLAEKAVSLGILAAIALLYQAILIPMIFRFGSEKGRIMLICVCFLPVVIFVFLAKLNLFSAVDFDGFFAKYGSILPYISVAAVVAIYILSVMFSIKIYTKKDL